MAPHPDLDLALQECLDKCQGHDQPLMCVAEYITNLIEQCDWSQSDAGEVASNALRELALLGPTTEANL